MKNINKKFFIRKNYKKKNNKFKKKIYIKKSKEIT